MYAVASGKGGVGKSSVTVNLAAAMAARGLSVGVLDADIYGHSVPRMMGTTDRPTQVESMILPPIAHDVKVISIAQFTQGNTPVVWRGPMLHRALQQFLADVYWGDLDVLLLDLPPGTGDVAISVAQLIPGAEILVVTTPQLAAAEVAERAGAIALQTRQRIVGVVENMSGLLLPDGTTMQVFGEGGGRQVAERLTPAVGADVPLLGQVPLDPALVAAGDSGVPLVLSAPDSAAGKELLSIADALSTRKRGLAGMSLGLDPAALIASAMRSQAPRVCRTFAARRQVASVSNGVASGWSVPASVSAASARRARLAGCVGGLVELAGEDRIVAVEQVFGQRGARRHATQLLQLAQRLAQIVELGAEVLAQLLGRPADVVARLTQRTRRPADGARVAARARGSPARRSPGPASRPSRRWRTLRAVVGTGVDGERHVPAVAHHLDRGVLADLQLPHRDDEFVGVGDRAVPDLDDDVVLQDARLLRGATGLDVGHLRARREVVAHRPGGQRPASGGRSCRP